MFNLRELTDEFCSERLEKVKDNKFFIEECNIVESMPKGIEYYKHIINNIGLDTNNKKNSYIMWICGKVEKLDTNKKVDFSNARISMPDIDVDIPIQHRGDIIEYITNKYGTDRVSQMITYQKMKGAKALTEVFRAYGDTSFEEIKEITKNIVEEAKIADQLQEMEEPSIIRWCLENKKKDFKDWCEIDEEGNLTGQYADRFSLAIRLEGTKSAQSKHAAGIVISPIPLSEMCPMVYDSKTKKQVAGMEMNDLEAIGLIKLDILGVAMLDKVMCVRDLLKVKGIDFNLDIEEIPLDCERTWALFAEGNTKGVFQLESRLGQMLSKELKPENMEHLAGLASIMRPGSLEAKKEDGKTVTTHYIEKKNNKEPVTYISDSLKEILDSSYGEMIYQEQAMAIAQKIAGFDLKQADILRKAIGKKKPEIMAALKEEFLEGCRKTNLVNEEVAHTLFNWIEKSQRYSFNKSHAVSYGFNAYLSAYCKAHYIKEFFTAYLKFSHDKIKPQKEIYELVNNAKAMDIWIMPPNIKNLNDEFELINDKIYFGLCDIKNVGKSVVDKLRACTKEIECKLNKQIKDWNWIDFLIFLSTEIKVNSLESLIYVGACDCFGKTRSSMIFECNLFRNLSNKELEWIQNNCKDCKNFNEILNKMISSGNENNKNKAYHNTKRLEAIKDIQVSLKNPPSDLNDKPHQISQLEYELLGVNITAHGLDESNTKYKANCTCQEYAQGYGKNKDIPVVIAAKIDYVRKIKTKNGLNPGQEMSFIEISDETGTINSLVLFPDQWDEYKHMVVEGNRLLFCGKRSSNKEKDSYIIELVEQL